MSCFTKYSFLQSIIRRKTISKLFKLNARNFSVVQQDGIVKSSSNDIIIPEINLMDLLLSKMENYLRFTAVECLSTGKSYTFEQLITLSTNFGKALRKKLKLEQGVVVALLLENSPEFAITTLGILSGGLILSTLNPSYTSEEISKQLRDCEAKLVITKTSLYNTVKEALQLSKLEAPIITVKEKPGESLPLGAINFEELTSEKISDQVFHASTKPSDLAILPYSSGTTGLPKGVQLTHRNMVSNLFQTTDADFNHYISPSDSYQDVFPLILPMFHIYGFSCGFLKQLCNGTKILTVTKFHPDSFTSMVHQYPITHLYAAPPLVLFMITSPNITPEVLKNLRFLISGGAPLGYSDEVRFREKFKNNNMVVGQAYGLTETSPIVSFIPTDRQLANKHGGSAGKLVANTFIKILAVNEEGTSDKALGANEVGELVVKGPQNTIGYFKRPEENDNLYKGDWLRTGDTAYYNEEGYLFITERLKELIKVKGFQVPPAELEAVIRSNPSVEDAAVIGIPHSILGEVPRAYVVLKENKSLKPADIQDYVAKKVAKYKHLVGGVKMIDAIPRTASGKILRRQLRKAYQENLI